MRKPETEGPRSQAGPPRLPARLGPAPRRSPRPPAQRQLGRRARPPPQAGGPPSQTRLQRRPGKSGKPPCCALRRNVPAPAAKAAPLHSRYSAQTAPTAPATTSMRSTAGPASRRAPPPPARFPESGVSPGLSVPSPTAPLIESPLSTTRIQTTTAFLHPAPAGTAAGWRPCPGQDLAAHAGAPPPEAQPRAHACGAPQSAPPAGRYSGTQSTCPGCFASSPASSDTSPKRMTSARQWCTHTGSRPCCVRSTHKSHKSVGTGTLFQ